MDLNAIWKKEKGKILISVFVFGVLGRELASLSLPQK